MMDGNRTVQQIWDAAIAALGDDAPTQDEVIRLLGQLHFTNVLQSDISPDTLEMIDRRKKQKKHWKQRLMNPLSMRFPLANPDRFLVKSMGFVKPLLSRPGISLWFIVVIYALVLAVLNWPELTHNMADRVLTPKNLFLLWLVYPFIKLLHELGHAFTVRIWGGEVHDMGIILLAFTPIPYVEASASSAFPDKYKRMAVAAAGMAVELFVASLALFLWLNIESGYVSAIAYNVMLIGGVSTLLFNGNPLLRFDGYYVLADWIEIPNLSNRSSKYLGYLLQRYILGLKDAQSPASSDGERPWFVIYGIAAFCYRIFVLAALTLFISSKFFFVGVVIAVWAVITQIILPVIRTSNTFYNSIGGRRKRTRLITASAMVLGLTTILLFVLPVPLRTSAQGVVSLPEYSRVRVGTDCFVSEILVPDGTEVKPGTPLLRCEDPFLESKVQILEATLRESEAKYNAENLQSRVQREILREKIISADAALARVHERQRELTVHSHNKGVFVLPDAESLVGRYVKQGTLLGYIMGRYESVAVLVVSQSDITLVRERTTGVTLRLAGTLNKPFTVNIDREIPAASSTLPSPVLGTSGGGDIPVNPSDPEGVQTLTKTFQFEIKLPIIRSNGRIGERVYAIFDHGFEPVALQWYRSLRRLFLSKFHV